MLKKIVSPIIAVVFLISVSGCASVIKGRQQYVDFDTNPSGATIIAKYPNAEPIKFKTPANMLLPTGKEPYSVEITKEGYEPVTISMPSRTSCWFWLNIILIPLFGAGLVTMGMDAGDGSAFTFVKSSYNVNLEPVSRR